MTPADLEAYLHAHIPISAAMGVRVVSTAGEVRLRAPLAPNVNHRCTVFGGSLAAVATLAAWSALRLRLGDDARLVIARQSTEYRLPVDEDFEAIAPLPSGLDWERFESAYRRRGKARIELTARVIAAGEVAVELTGTFAALAVSS